MPFTFMVVNDQAKGNDQLKVAIIVGSDGIVVTIKPANGLFLPPGNLSVVPVNREFPSPVPVDMVNVGAAMTLIVHLPE
jgi:hypothetical protein